MKWRHVNVMVVRVRRSQRKRARARGGGTSRGGRRRIAEAAAEWRGVGGRGGGVFSRFGVGRFPSGVFGWTFPESVVRWGWGERTVAVGTKVGGVWARRSWWERARSSVRWSAKLDGAVGGEGRRSRRGSIMPVPKSWVGMPEAGPRMPRGRRRVLRAKARWEGVRDGWGVRLGGV